MIWDYDIETNLFGYDDSNDEFLSDTYAIEAESGPLLRAEISGSDSSQLRLYRSSDAVNFTQATIPKVASVLNVSGVLDFTSLRAPYWRFGFRNTESSPSSTPLCTVKWGVLKEDYTSNVRRLHDRPPEIHLEVETTGLTGWRSDDVQDEAYGAFLRKPTFKVYGNYSSLDWHWEA